MKHQQYFFLVLKHKYCIYCCKWCTNNINVFCNLLIAAHNIFRVCLLRRFNFVSISKSILCSIGTYKTKNQISINFQHRGGGKRREESLYRKIYGCIYFIDCVYFHLWWKIQNLLLCNVAVEEMAVGFQDMRKQGK